MVLTPRRGLERYPLDVTPAEADVGFSVDEAASGVHAVVAKLDDELRVVKQRRYDGAIEYVVCDRDLHPLYQPAATLEELKHRFHLRSSRPDTEE
jgi:hypothetical protein